LPSDTLASEWVLREIQHAHDLGKPMIPVFQETYKPIAAPPNDAVAALLQYQGVFVDDRRNQRYDQSVRELAELIDPVRRRPRWPLLAALIGIVAVIGVALFLLLRSLGTTPVSASPTPTDDARAAAALTQTQVAQINTPPTATFTPTLTPTVQPGTSSPTVSSADIAQTLFWQTRTAIAERYTDTPTPDQTGTIQAELNTVAAQFRATDVQATANAVASFTRTPTNTATPTFTRTDTPTFISTLGFIPSPTLTPSEMPPSTPIPVGTSNDVWTPVESDFGGVPMVLVPAGCFMMGSNESENESPIHEVCITRPFWLDKHEVSNGQFSRLNGKAPRPGRWTDDDLPRERITWTEAAAFCEQRGATLPTEAQWEYAARGTQGKQYPWGDGYEKGYANVARDVDETSPVGRYPDGVSWVGAYDLSGNVWEWVADWYAAGYYKTSRKNDPVGPTSGKYRVARGGSWYNYTPDGRAARRINLSPDTENINLGFRCARSF
jgi:formylglycine-generating enzyme required for sulfatase activity